jgi:hypothetical protein
MRYDAGTYSKEATPQELKDEVSRLEAQDAQTLREIEECKRRADPYDSVCPWKLKRDRLMRQRAENAGRLNNLRYELRCSRSRDDYASDGEWRPMNSTYTYGADD